MVMPHTGVVIKYYMNLKYKYNSKIKQWIISYDTPGKVTQRKQEFFRDEQEYKKRLKELNATSQ